MDAWINQEIKGCNFPDQRLGQRLGKLLRNLSQKTGDSLPSACQDWAGTKAAYRFLDNPRVDEGTILAGHFQSTQSRLAATKGPVLVLHDTTEFSFQRTNIAAIGKTNKTCVRPGKPGRRVFRTVCGLLMHSSLAVTVDGLPLGLAAIKFWTRKKFKGTNALKRKINPTRVPIEKKESIRWVENVQQATALLGDPRRCVHIGDRESDIFELFCAAEKSDTNFLVRTCVDRLAQDGDSTVSKVMSKQPVQGTHSLEVRSKKGFSRKAKLKIRFAQVKIHPPIGKSKRYPPLTLNVIHATEERPSNQGDRIEWKLLTNLPVKTLADALEKLAWYALRWKIETFHKVLKSGCKAEVSKLRTASRLTNLMAINCILAWRVFWLCMINRAAPAAPREWVLTDSECHLLDHLYPSPPSKKRKRISHYLTVIARLGGYLARSHDPPPGNCVVWRGFARLTDIHLGFTLSAKFVGN